MNFGKYDVQRPKNERKGVVLPEKFREKPAPKPDGRKCIWSGARIPVATPKKGEPNTVKLPCQGCRGEATARVLSFRGRQAVARVDDHDEVP